MSYICKKYPGDCVVEDVFCSKRFKKALDSPDEGGLEFCRSCDKGKTAWEALKVEATKQPLCSLCGHPMKNINGGICTPCRVKTVQEKAKISGPKGEDMKGVISKKTCVDCNTEYVPTCNVQKRCPECKIKKKKNDNEQRKESQGKETEKLHRITEKFSDRTGRASESDIPQAFNDNIVNHLLTKRQEHIAAVADIQETLRNLRKYAGVDIPDEDMLAI